MASYCPHCGASLMVDESVCPICQKDVAPPKVTPSTRKTTNRYAADSGWEWRTQSNILGIPLIHIAIGRKDGRLRVAKGVIAIGQFGIGLITFAQFGVGVLFGFGQFMIGFTAIAQMALTLAFGVGQFAVGYVAIGQLAFGYYGLAQAGWAVHLWSSSHRDELALVFFRDLQRWLLDLWHNIGPSPR